jgi:hypothetical protein
MDPNTLAALRATHELYCQLTSQKLSLRFDRERSGIHYESREALNKRVCALQIKFVLFHWQAESASCFPAPRSSCGRFGKIDRDGLQLRATSSTLIAACANIVRERFSLFAADSQRDPPKRLARNDFPQASGPRDSARVLPFERQRAPEPG